MELQWVVAEKRKKILTVAVPAVVVCAALVILLITLIIPSIKLSKAKAYIEQGKYEAAYRLLNGLDYKNSEELREDIKPQYQISRLSSAEVGSYVSFGAYEQNNDLSDGAEDIEWLVLAKDGERVLVVSKYALDCQPYNEKYAEVAWDNCSLRAWLNDAFLNSAFTGREQAMIPSVSVGLDTDPIYVVPGRVTTDKIFLLSITEAREYFASDSARRCRGTAYCYERGAVKHDNGNCWWWIRSQGNYSYNGSFFRSDGSYFHYGQHVDYKLVAVRPAMWIDFS